MNNLVRCIEDIRQRLDALRRHKLKETPTRTIIVDPLLEALGWDIRDPDEVELEYQTIDGRAVDYALKLNGQRKPVLFVEAKALGEPLDDVKSEAQVVRYAATEGVVWCILTNGVRWKVYRSMEECSAPEKLMFEVSLDPKDTAGIPVSQLAERVWRFSREEMARGTLDELGEQTFTDGKIRKALDIVMRDPPRAFLNLIREATGDHRLKPQRISESLRRLARSTEPANVQKQQVQSSDARISHESQTRGKPTGGDRHRVHRSRQSQSTYGELHHTSGKPQETVELYRAIERICLSLSPGAVQKCIRAKSINYEAESRVFCSMHLRRSGLRVWLYLKLHRLTNPPSFARDVSNVGHWGGGDLELAISSIAQVQEAEPLIHASYESRCCKHR